MGTRALEIVRFRNRYYIRYHQFDGYFEGLGAQIVASIPSNPEDYQKWLESMRAKYAAKERTLIEQDVYRAPDVFTPTSLQFEPPPSELPLLDGYDAEYFYTINLDHEVLTMNHSIHWKLGNIPRQDDLWLRAIVDSVYRYKPTISSDLCPEEHMASLALELPERNQEIGYDFRVVVARTRVAGARQAFLTRVLADILIKHNREIIRFGREWSPDSFPFRELTFALVSVASGQVKFRPLAGHPCGPQGCHFPGCSSYHDPKPYAWFDKQWAADDAPLLEFGSMSHRPGEPPGASPSTTMYWLEDVLVSLALVVDGEAITEAVTWGTEQGRTNFQVIIMSLFEVSFAEVLWSRRADSPFVKVSEAIPLSPLEADYCVSTHPRERPEMKPGMEIRHHYGELIMQSNCTGTARKLQSQFPGCAALVNFFDVAASRRSASKSAGVLPTELYGHIVDEVDYDTWKTCSVVSREFRSYCLLKYRLDDRVGIVAGPFVRLRNNPRKERLLSFDFENMQTGMRLPMMAVPHVYSLTKEFSWMPVIGSDRKTLMTNVRLEYEVAEDVMVEADSDSE